jgi:2,4-dienoyl-CoA reductase-like NADH-dependent reductase (Old Yellow Enzyme family)
MTGTTFETGNALVRNGFADAVAFGAPSISNPDLVERFSNDLKLSLGDPDTQGRSRRLCRLFDGDRKTWHEMGPGNFSAYLPRLRVSTDCDE